MPKAGQRPPSGQVRNAERLRHAIDVGKSGDKRAMRDPAAAPLGTDEEAGGTPPTPEQVAEAAQHEMARRVLHEGERTSNAVILIVVLLIAVATVGAIVWTYR